MFVGKKDMEKFIQNSVRELEKRGMRPTLLVVGSDHWEGFEQWASGLFVNNTGQKVNLNGFLLVVGGNEIMVKRVDSSGWLLELYGEKVD